MVVRSPNLHESRGMLLRLIYFGVPTNSLSFCILLTKVVMHNVKHHVTWQIREISTWGNPLVGGISSKSFPALLNQTGGRGLGWSAVLLPWLPPGIARHGRCCKRPHLVIYAMFHAPSILRFFFHRVCDGDGELNFYQIYF